MSWNEVITVVRNDGKKYCHRTVVRFDWKFEFFDGWLVGGSFCWISELGSEIKTISVLEPDVVGGKSSHHSRSDSPPRRYLFPFVGASLNSLPSFQFEILVSATIQDTAIMSSEDKICYGTKKIIIRSNIKSSSVERHEGFLSIDGDGDAVIVNIHDGSHLYQTRIKPEETKLNWRDGHDDDDDDKSEEDKLAVLADFFLVERDTVSMSCLYQADDSAGGGSNIKLKLNEKLSNGMQKTLWPVVDKNQVLKRQPSSVLLPFLQHLGSTISQQKQSLSQHEQQVSSLRNDLNNWKQTAQSLEGGWQTEKSKLMEQFYAVYKQTHDVLRKTKLDLTNLQNQTRAGGGSVGDYSSSREGLNFDGAANNAESSSRPSKKKKRSKPVDDYYDNNDMDMPIFDDEQIARLAGEDSQKSSGNSPNDDSGESVEQRQQRKKKKSFALDTNEPSRVQTKSGSSSRNEPSGFRKKESRNEDAPRKKRVRNEPNTHFDNPEDLIEELENKPKRKKEKPESKPAAKKGKVKGLAALCADLNVWD